MPNCQARSSTGDSGGEGLGARLQGADHGGQLRVFERRAELADIGAGHEHLPGADDHAADESRIGVDLPDGVEQPLPDGPRSGVDRWVIDHDNAHIASLFEADNLSA